MNEKKLKQLNVLMIIVAIVCFIFICMFSFVFSPKDSKRIGGENLKELNDSWIVKSYENETDVLVDMPIKVDADANETIVLLHTVPDDVTKDTVLVFPTRFQNVVVSINNQTIYTNGVLNDKKVLNSAVPCLNVIDIGDAKSGDMITIYIASAYKKYSGRAYEFLYGTRGAVISDIVNNNGISFVVALILLVVSIVLLVALRFGRKDRINKQRALYAFLFVAGTAIWSVTGNPILQIVTGNIFGVYMTHMTVMLVLPIFYIMLQRCFASRLRYARILEFGIYIFGLNFLTGVIFQMMGICDFASYSMFTNVLIVLGLLMLSGIMYLAADTYKDKAIYKNYIANLVLTAACVLEGICSLFKFYQRFDNIILQIGLFVFMVMLLVLVQSNMQSEIDKENKEVIDNAEKEKLFITKHINTPLIYSSLNHTINSIKETNKNESKLVYATSIYMRYNIKTLTEKKMVDFSKELEYIKAYLNMEKGMHDNLEVTIEDKIDGFMVPFNTIEPLVENAVINGALKAEGNSRIVVRSYERLDCFAIQIVDNGNGISPEKKFTGIQDFHEIKARLKKECRAGIDINCKSDRGTIITIKIPKDGYIIKE